MTAYTVAAKRRRKRASVATRRHRQRDAAVVETEIHDNEPTPERKAKGAWTVGTGRRVWQDHDATPLRRALRLKKLTAEQVEAGEWVEGLLRALDGSPSGRSCLDTSPRGGAETNPERIARISQARDRARARVTAEQWAVIRSVCFDHHPIGDMRPTRRRYRCLSDGLAAISEMRLGVRKAA